MHTYCLHIMPQNQDHTFVNYYEMRGDRVVKGECAEVQD